MVDYRNSSDGNNFFVADHAVSNAWCAQSGKNMFVVQQSFCVFVFGRIHHSTRHGKMAIAPQACVEHCEQNRYKCQSHRIRIFSGFIPHQYVDQQYSNNAHDVAHSRIRRGLIGE